MKPVSVMTVWRITLKGLQGVRGLLKCILAEFMKVKRKKFVLGTLLVAWILPVPLTIIVVKAKLSFDILFMFAIEFGFFLILPIVLGIIASSSINVEYDNQTFKKYALNFPYQKV